MEREKNGRHVTLMDGVEEKEHGVDRAIQQGQKTQEAQLVIFKTDVLSRDRGGTSSERTSVFFGLAVNI